MIVLLGWSQLKACAVYDFKAVNRDGVGLRLGDHVVPELMTQKYVAELVSSQINRPAVQTKYVQSN